MALCATTALAGAVSRLCVRGARGRFRGGFGPVPGVVFPLLPPSRPAYPALRVAGCPVRVSLTLARWYAIPGGLCVPRARSGCPSGGPRVSFSCVCARALAVSAPRWVVWRAHLAWSRHWALVGPFHVVRAPPRVLPRSRAPSGVLGGGRSGPGSPLLGLGLRGRRLGVPGGVPSSAGVSYVGCAPSTRSPRARGRDWGGGWVGCVGSPTDVHWGKRRAVAPPGRRLTVGRGVALPLSVPLPSLGRRQSGRHWRCAVHRGRGPPYHSGSCSPSLSGYDLCGVPVRRRGPVCSSRPPCGPAAGAGGRVTLRPPSRVGGVHSPCHGGGVAPRPPRSRSGRRPVVPLSGPPLRRARAVGADVPPRGGGG